MSEQIETFICYVDWAESFKYLSTEQKARLLDLMFNFAMIMLLDDEYEPDEEKRIDKAFRYAGKNPEDEKRFQEFVRGGVDVLYEKLIEGASEPEDYINNLYDFVEDFYERFYEEVDIDKITKLCSSR